MIYKSLYRNQGINGFEKIQVYRIKKIGINRTNERNNIVDDNQRMKIRNFGYLNQGALKGQILFYRIILDGNVSCL